MIYGRDRERAQLRELLDDAEDCHGSLVLISGEAGIGKTTLVDDLIHEAEERDCLILTGGCYDLTTTPPYGPWIEALRAYQPGEGDPALPAWFGNPEELERVGSQARLFDEMRAFFASVAEKQSLVIVLEDLHWSDAASLDALRYLARHLTDIQMLLVSTYRDDEITRRDQLFRLLPILVRESAVQRLDLRRWSDRDTRQAIVSQYCIADPDTERLTSYIQRLSAGNPLFVGELLRSLEYGELLRQVGDGWELGDLTDTQIPTLVQQLIEGRLSQLSEEAQSALEIASVIGHTFAVDLWGRVLDVEDLLLSEIVSEAAAARIINELVRGRVQFTHALVREALYERIVWLRRRLLHQHVGEILAGTPDADPDAVSHHFQQADDRRAYDWLLRAADRAERSIAMVAANERLEAAIRLIIEDSERASERGWLFFRMAQNLMLMDPKKGQEHLAEAERLSVAANDEALKSRIRFLRGVILIYDGSLQLGLEEVKFGMVETEVSSPVTYHPSPIGSRYPLSLYVIWLANVGRYAEALDLGEPQIDHPDPEMRMIGQGIGRAYSARGEPDKALRTLEAARRDGEIAGWPISELSSGIAFVDTQIAYRTDQVDERRSATAALSEAYRRSEGAVARFLSEHQISSIGDIPVLVGEGRWDEAEEIHSNLRTVPTVYGRQRATGFLATLACNRGDRGQAWRLIADVLPDGSEQEPGDCVFTAGLELQRAAISLDLAEENLDGMLRWLRSYDHWMNWSGAVLGLAEGQLGWARYHLAAGDLDKAREHTERSYELASDPRQPLALIAADRFLGQLDVDEEKYDDAKAHLDASLELAERCETPFEQALTLVVMAERAAKLGEFDEARQLIRRVREICEPLGARPTLERVAEIEAMLPRTRRTSSTFPAGLTQREVEVLRLVAQGMTDAEAAEELFLSPRTIGQHLRNVYNKINVSNRAAAASWATEHGLT